MSDDQDDASKTEEPSHKRLQDAAERGQVITSREVTTFFIMLSLAALIMVVVPYMMHEVKHMTEHYIMMPEDIEINEENFQSFAWGVVLDIFKLLAAPMILLIAAIFLANAVQNRFLIATDPIMPKLEKISIIKGIARMFSRRNFMELVKGVIKIIIVSAVAVAVLKPHSHEVPLMITSDAYGLLDYLQERARQIMIGICSLLFLFAILDYLYQRFEYMKNLRMTKQELKDEYKQQEGDPLIKQRLRQIRRERMRSRMMEAVPESDVVITNPTHYAVALKYDTLTMSAPMVVAKGKDKVAQRIREIAERNKVVIVRNPPLSRLLYDNAAVDEEIPLAYYRAVANVIGYVYKLRGVNPATGKKQ